MDKQYTVDDVIRDIKLKRSGNSLKYSAIHNIIQGYVNGSIPDHQMASWIATMDSVGMTFQEIKYLTRAYVNSGNNSSLQIKNNGNFIVDKHSTGGIGDKVTLIVAPIVAACGVSVIKLSGRGLGYAGGTIDKLESIKGLKLNLSCNDIHKVLETTGMVIASQSNDLVPGDKAIYNLRDLIGYEDSIPLIAASIMSKKIATAANGLVLDVKSGSGALIEDYAKSRNLAKIMLRLSYEFKINCRIVLSNMDNPLGYAIGNLLEVQEALEALKGKNIPYLTELCFVIARLMIQTSDPSISEQSANSAVQKAIDSGVAYNKFLNWIKIQGGNVDQLIKQTSLQNTKYKDVILSKRNGWIKSINAKIIGIVSMEISKKIAYNGNIIIDYSTGILLLKHVSDKIKIGEPIAEIYYNNRDITGTLNNRILESFDISDSPITRTTIVHEIL
ncbi:MAG: thymidine phosphorylase [Rickettsiaceae bacterium]